MEENGGQTELRQGRRRVTKLESQWSGFAEVKLPIAMTSILTAEHVVETAVRSEGFEHVRSVLTRIAHTKALARWWRLEGGGSEVVAGPAL